MYQLSVKSHFDAAHYIKDYPGKCSRMHGHRWEVEVVLEGRTLNSLNILADFGEVKKLLNNVLDEHFDHYLLNETLEELHVTAEFLAKWLYEELRDYMGKNLYGVRLVRVAVWESPDCCVKYYGGD